MPSDFSELLKAAFLTDYFISHGDDSPSGENLEYDPDFMAMELVAQPEEERQAGDSIVEGSEPNFKDLAKKAGAILERSHDIRAAVHLANSELRNGGLPEFAEAVRYIRYCLEDHWGTCHPQLDEDDDDDPMMRINAVTNLAGTTTVLRGLRQAAPLTNSRSFGRVTLRDIEIARGDVSPSGDETPMSSGDIDAAFQDTDNETLKTYLAGANDALEHVNAIDAVFMEKTPGYGPSLEPLQKMLGSLISMLSKFVGEDEPEHEAAGDTDGAAVGGSGVGSVASGAPGQIASRADVTATLERIIDYYSRHEPSSPLPILLKRAKRLVGANFMEIINDLAPQGADNVKAVGGSALDETVDATAASSAAAEEDSGW